MKSQESARVAARLGGKVLKNVDKYFSGRPYAVAVEILQNARRAGANRVEVETSESGSVVVRDNGRGLAREDAPVLLTFGGSANGADVEFREDPAGMGFFALAGRRVCVASRDWQMTIAPDTFTGGQDALLCDGEEVVEGLRIEVDSFAAGRPEAAAAFQDAGAPMPMEVIVDGVAVPHLAFDKYTSGESASRLSRAIHGCEITVCRWPRIRDAYKADVSRYGPQGDLDMVVDMFGQTFRVSNSSPDTFKLYFPRFLSSSVEDTLALPPRDGDWQEEHQKPFWRIAVKVGEASVLAPRLPERDGIVINDGWRTIAAEIEGMLAQLASDIGPNAIPETSPIRKIAKALGIPLLPPRTSVKTATYESRYGSYGAEAVIRQALLELRDGDAVAWRRADAPDPSECLIKPKDLEVAAESAIAFALVGNPALQLRIIESFGTAEEHAAAGYREADRASAKVSTKDGATFNLDLATDLTGPIIGGTGRASAILDSRTKESGILASSIMLKLSGGGLSIKMPADVISWNDDDSVDEETRFVAVEGVAEHQIIRQMMDVYQWYSDSHEADSYDSQKEYTENTFMDMIIPVTEGEVSAIVSKAQALLSDALRTLRSSSTVKISQITIKPLPRKAGDDGQRGSHRLTITLGDGSRHTREI